MYWYHLCYNTEMDQFIQKLWEIKQRVFKIIIINMHMYVK